MKKLKSRVKKILNTQRVRNCLTISTNYMRNQIIRSIFSINFFFSSILKYFPTKQLKGKKKVMCFEESRNKEENELRKILNCYVCDEYVSESSHRKSLEKEKKKKQLE